MPSSLPVDDAAVARVCTRANYLDLLSKSKVKCGAVKGHRKVIKSLLYSANRSHSGGARELICTHLPLQTPQTTNLVLIHRV